MRIIGRNYSVANRNKDDKTKRFNTQLLTNDETARKRYEATIEQKIQEENITTWNEMLTALTNAAEETIGYNKSRERGKEDDTEIKE